MGIRTVWNEVEKILIGLGFELADVDDIPQPRRCTMRIVEVPTQQRVRGAIGSGVVRVTWFVDIVLTYDVGTDKRVERKVAEDAEDVITAIYSSTSLSNHYFDGATIDRNADRKQVVNTMRFVFQEQAA